MIHDRKFIMEKTSKLLAALGDTPRQVADKLTEYGVKGHCSNVGRCAVAVYLLSELDVPVEVSDEYVNVGSEVAIIGGFTNILTTGRAYVALPPPVRDFIPQFDRGWYPKLMAEDSPPPSPHPSVSATPDVALYLTP